ncbi:MAG: hypothetical protein R3B96_23515 [Pirellulaceae bacterium]
MISYRRLDTPAVWELNIWYHTLNCGYGASAVRRTPLYLRRASWVAGRVYVKLPPGSDLTYEAWVHGLKEGRSYVGDGRSHLVDFRIGDFESARLAMMGGRVCCGRSQASHSRCA